jgi:uncharacterized membrane protein YkvI
MFTHWLYVSLFGMNPFYMRIVSLIIHSFVGLMIFDIAKKFNNNKFNDRENIIALLFLWAFILHPIHNQAINLIIQRSILLSTFFMLVSLSLFLAYSSDNNRKKYFGSLLFFLLSINLKVLL